MAKSELRIEARKRRLTGESIKNIARELNVSSSTASLWCRDIILTPNQITQLEKNSKDPHYGRRLTYSLAQQSIRQKESEKIRIDALNSIGEMSGRDKLIAGIALYWAEGFKKDKMAGFANTDPIMIKFALKWLQDQLHIPIESIRVRVGINQSHKYRTNEIEKYWSDLIGIPLNKFQKPYYQQVNWKKTYENPEKYFGTLRIRILKSTKLLKMIKGMIEALGFQHEMLNTI